MERRHQIRIPLSTRVVLSHDGREISTETANVSEGGMFVPTAEPLPVGTRVAFRLSLSSGKREIKGQALVVWSQSTHQPGGRAQGNGLEFQSLGQEGHALLKQAIRRHLEDQPMIRAQ